MKKDVTTAVEVQGKFSLTRKIKALLNLGEEGKLDSFFERIIKTLKKEVAAFEQNAKNEKFKYEELVDGLNDKLEDAQTDLENAYTNVDMTKLETNESQKSYQEVYLNNLDSKALAIKAIEKQLADAKEAHDEVLKGINNNIESLNKRISMISQA